MPLFYSKDPCPKTTRQSDAASLSTCTSMAGRSSPLTANAASANVLLQYVTSSGVGVDTSSGDMTMSTAVAGTSGASGVVAIQTGVSTNGPSGSVSVSSGDAVGGAGDSVSLSVGSGSSDPSPTLNADNRPSTMHTTSNFDLDLRSPNLVESKFNATVSVNEIHASSVQNDASSPTPPTKRQRIIATKKKCNIFSDDDIEDELIQKSIQPFSHDDSYDDDIKELVHSSFEPLLSRLVLNSSVIHDSASIEYAVVHMVPCLVIRYSSRLFPHAQKEHTFFFCEESSVVSNISYYLSESYPLFYFSVNGDSVEKDISSVLLRFKCREQLQILVDKFDRYIWFFPTIHDTPPEQFIKLLDEMVPQETTITHQQPIDARGTRSLHSTTHDEDHEYSSLLQMLVKTRQELGENIAMVRSLLSYEMNKSMDALCKIVLEDGIDKKEEYFGLLIDNIQVIDSKFHTAVEVAAGESLFSVIVKSATTAQDLSTRLQKDGLCPVSFIILDEMNIPGRKLPENMNVSLLTTRCITFNRKVDRAVFQVLGNKLVAENEEDAASFSRQADMDVITLNGCVSYADGRTTQLHESMNG
jgi:hypothetical protein